MDSMEISMQSDTTIKPQCSFHAFFCQPADHGPVYTDENHAVIIPQANAGDNKTAFCNYLGLEDKDFQTSETRL